MEIYRNTLNTNNYSYNSGNKYYEVKELPSRLQQKARKDIDPFKFILIPRKMLVKIANNFYLTPHSKQRIDERVGDKDLKSLMLNSPLVWRDTNGTVNIAVNPYAYFVVVEENGEFYVKTFVERSKNDATVVDKFVFTYMGYKRNENSEKWSKPTYNEEYDIYDKE